MRAASLNIKHMFAGMPIPACAFASGSDAGGTDRVIRGVIRAGSYEPALLLQAYSSGYLHVAS